MSPKFYAFNDWPLRRELYGQGLLDRNLDGSNYQLGKYGKN